MRNKLTIPELPPPKSITYGDWPLVSRDGKLYDKNTGEEVISVDLSEFLNGAVPHCGCAACEGLRKVTP